MSFELIVCVACFVLAPYPMNECGVKNANGSGAACISENPISVALFVFGLWLQQQQQQHTLYESAQFSPVVYDQLFDSDSLI